jgi:two-component system, OmpR family, sensor histidine kinase KdpD
MKSYEDIRPDPDEILASIRNEESQNKKGKLKIFFGMCAGVGKTFSMLETAHIEKSKGKDIVIGYVETHKREDTNKLIKGLEIIPRQILTYKGTKLEDTNPEAIISRKPDIVIIDELAHTNAPGCRHLKRYQDVLDILENGISVYTTLNVQHLESRSEIVAQITGIIVRETVPDEIFEKADEVELVDITPEELIQRFEDGKVYAQEQSREALNNFFKIGNITALREMSLRIVAERVDKELMDYMHRKRIKGPWKSGLHLMALIGPGPHSAKLLRWAKNFSYSMGATLLALYVESPRKLSPAGKEQLNKNLNLARQLGAEIITTSGNDIVKSILDIGHKENITHIIIGKPRYWNLMSYFRLGNFVNRLIKYSGNIDVYVVGSDLPDKNQYFRYFGMPSFSSDFSKYFISAFFTVLTAAFFYPLKGLIGYQVVAFGLLFTVSILALFVGIGPILLSATLSALLWDFFFLPPPFTLHVARLEDVMMLLMYFIIALIGGVLTLRVRRQEKLARERELRTNALYQFTRELSMTSGTDEVINISIKYISKYSRFDSAIILQEGNNVLGKNVRPAGSFSLTDAELSIAEWSFKHLRKAGKFTDTLPSSNYTFYPITGNKMNLGVVVVKPDRSLTADEEDFWDAFRTQIANGIERELLNEIARRASVLDESDRLYKSLFSSISHELRIPIATIMGSTDTLLSNKPDDKIKQNLYREINKASTRLNGLIENLLNMSRLESGRIKPNPDWCDAHDLSAKVVDDLKDELAPFNLEINIPENMPLVRVDIGLMEQVLHNLVLNSTQYATPGTTIRIKMYYDKPSFIMQIMDRGPGFPPNELLNVFDKFYRLEKNFPGGLGLGLSIVKGFVDAHNGTVTAENRQNGGAVITVRIPSEIHNINDVSLKRNLGNE